MKLKTLLWSLLTIAALSFAGCSDDDDPVVPQPQPEQPELTFMFEVNNLTATSADLKITPSANDLTYGAGFVLAAQLDKEGEQAVVDMALNTTKPENLLKGVQTIKAEALAEETEYIVFAVGIKDGKAASKLGYKRFTTLKNEAVDPQPEVKEPQVELTAQVGKPDGSEKKSVITMNAKCTSKDASYASFSVFEKDVIDAFLAEKKLTIEEFMEQNANNPQMVTKFEADWLADFNMAKPEGLSLMFEKLPAQTSFSLILDARNAEGRVVVTKVATTEEDVVKVLNTESFRKLVWDYETNASWKYEGELPCVIDCFATWCGPCKAFAPTFHKLAGEYEGSIIFYQMDVDQNPDVFWKLAQMGGNKDGGIPFFCFAPMSGAPKFKTGGANEAGFRKLLDEYCLAGGKAAVPFKKAPIANFAPMAVRAN